MYQVAVADSSEGHLCSPCTFMSLSDRSADEYPQSTTCLPAGDDVQQRVTFGYNFTLFKRAPWAFWHLSRCLLDYLFTFKIELG